MDSRGAVGNGGGNEVGGPLELIAASVLEGKKLREALKDVQPGSVLAFNYFGAKIEPILATQGADGKACVFCHASHVIFKLHPPNDQGAFSDQDSEDNYKYAMHVVDISDPTESLMLLKPTSPRTARAMSGITSPLTTADNGGMGMNKAGVTAATALPYPRLLQTKYDAVP